MHCDRFESEFESDRDWNKDSTERNNRLCLGHFIDSTVASLCNCLMVTRWQSVHVSCCSAFLPFFLSLSLSFFLSLFLSFFLSLIIETGPLSFLPPLSFCLQQLWFDLIWRTGDSIEMRWFDWGSGGIGISLGGRFHWPVECGAARIASSWRMTTN